jgi:sec-independent protein translocase protein TatC
MYSVSCYISEIRQRLFYLGISSVWCFGMCYHYKYYYLYLLGKPFLKFQRTFIFLDFTEGFTILVHVCILITCLSCIPYILYQSWCFLVPSWYAWERAAWTRLLWWGLVGGTLQLSMIYWSVFPMLCTFFLKFQTTSQIYTLHYLPRITSSITATVWGILGCLVMFQIPWVLGAASWQNLLSCWTFAKWRKFALFLCVLISALLSPPDIVSQLILTLYFWVVYEIGIIFGLVGKC